MTSRSTRAAALAGALAGYHLLPSVLTLGAVRSRLAPGLAGRGLPHHVGLTFDDGPDPRSTPEFLVELRRLDVQATFFVLGSMLERSPDLGRRLVAEGHELAVHGWTHRNHLCRTPLAIASDLARTAALIERLAGTPPRYWRPPYGILTGAGQLAGRGLGLRAVLWTAWGQDWTAKATSGSVLNTARSGLAGGGVLLLHDSDCTGAPGSWRATLAAVPGVVEHCRAQGWTVGPLREHGLSEVPSLPAIDRHAPRPRRADH